MVDNASWGDETTHDDGKTLSLKKQSNSDKKSNSATAIQASLKQKGAIKPAPQMSTRMGDRFVFDEIKTSLHTQSQLPSLKGYTDKLQEKLLAIQNSTLMTEDAKRAMAGQTYQDSMTYIATETERLLTEHEKPVQEFELDMRFAIANAGQDGNVAELRSFMLINGGVASFINDKQACLAVLNAPQIIQQSLLGSGQQITETMRQKTQTSSKKTDIQAVYKGAFGDKYATYLKGCEVLETITTEHSRLAGLLVEQIGKHKPLTDAMAKMNSKTNLL